MSTFYSSIDGAVESANDPAYCCSNDSIVYHTYITAIRTTLIGTLHSAHCSPYMSAVNAAVNTAHRASFDTTNGTTIIAAI